MNFNPPIIVDGIEYNLCDVSLSSNGIVNDKPVDKVISSGETVTFQAKTLYTQSVNLTITPMRRNENNEIELCPDLLKRCGVRTFDIMTQNPKVIQLYANFIAGIQALLDDGTIKPNE